jgi:hypothetical protein
MSAQAPAVIPGIDDKHDINGVEDIEHDVKGEIETRTVIVTEEDVSLARNCSREVLISIE